MPDPQQTRRMIAAEGRRAGRQWVRSVRIVFPWWLGLMLALIVADLLWRVFRHG